MAYGNGKEETTVSGSKGPQLPRQSGLVGLFLEYTKDIPSPEVFRLWVAIHGVGSAVERRVWTPMAAGDTFPNVFVFLVGPPDIGKSVSMRPMVDLLRRSNACEIGPNDMSKQGLLDALSKCGRAAILDGEAFDFHYMAVFISEVTNFMAKYDASLAGLLTDLWDCPPYNEESKRHGLGKMIVFPGMSFIMGTATESLGSVIPNEMWGSGFMARVIMVNSTHKIIPKNVFEIPKKNEKLAQEIEMRLTRLGEVKGPMKWTPGAQDLYQSFLEQPSAPPSHSRLLHYNARRPRHLCKLAMISALSEERMIVTEGDFATAESWLGLAEASMNDVFTGMVSHEDGALLEEIAHQLRLIYARTGEPVSGYELTRLMTKIVRHERIETFLETAVNADYIRRVAGTSGPDAQYVPSKPG